MEIDEDYVLPDCSKQEGGCPFCDPEHPGHAEAVAYFDSLFGICPTKEVTDAH